MRSTAWLWFAVLSAAALAAPRPRYGGTLRIELRAAADALDPAEPDGPAAHLLPLVFDRLVRLDREGRPHPSLAASWQHDPDCRRWEFRLRPGVRFHDGSPLSSTPALAAVLEAGLGGVSVISSGDTLLVRSPRPAPDLPVELGLRGFVYSRTPEGVPVGTGPFRLARWDPRRRAAFSAFEDYWGGRPFLDAVEVEMARPLREQFIDLEVGKADIVETGPAEARRAADRGRRVWSSAPVDLVALVFRAGDDRVREAVALSIDRAAIHNVLLQRRGEIAGGLLPQWLSGYAFLFPAAPDLARARKLASDAPPPARTLTLGYDASEPLHRLIADRVAVNARDAGITLQVAPWNPRCEVRLAQTRIASLDPARALAAVAAAFGLGETVPGVTADSQYAAERALLDNRRAVPLFHLPESYAVASQVREWMPAAISRLGGWNLADLWLDAAAP